MSRINASAKLLGVLCLMCASPHAALAGTGGVIRFEGRLVAPTCATESERSHAGLQVRACGQPVAALHAKAGVYRFQVDSVSAHSGIAMLDYYTAYMQARRSHAGRMLTRNYE